MPVPPLFLKLQHHQLQVDAAIVVTWPWVGLPLPSIPLATNFKKLPFAIAPLWQLPLLSAYAATRPHLQEPLLEEMPFAAKKENKSILYLMVTYSWALGSSRRCTLGCSACSWTLSCWSLRLHGLAHSTWPLRLVSSWLSWLLCSRLWFAIVCTLYTGLTTIDYDRCIHLERICLES